jgi:hypothetical protein
MIEESVILCFDPDDSEDEQIRAVFADREARMLWLAIKQGHITSTNFCKSCLRYAEVIRKKRDEGKLNEEILFKILSGFLFYPEEGVVGSRERQFATELLPFINGDKSIHFRIKSK